MPQCKARACAMDRPRYDGPARAMKASRMSRRSSSRRPPPFPAAFLAAFLAAALALPAAAQPVDEAVVAAIREEGLERSQVMRHVGWLSDVRGPRVTGTPAIKQAVAVAFPLRP